MASRSRGGRTPTIGLRMDSNDAAGVTPTEYEKAVVERFRTLFPPPRFFIKHNIRLRGSKSKARRQIDVSVFEQGDVEPFLIAEAKRHRRRVDAVKAGALIALVQDVGTPAVMVSTSGFSVAAENHLAAEGIETLVITLSEAKGLRWIPLIEEKFALDRRFRELTGDLVEAVRTGDIDAFLDSGIHFEEWMAALLTSKAAFSDCASNILRALARSHVDDGVRFNAIQLLADAGQLRDDEIEALLQSESDVETRELLVELLAEAG
jgi:hypothetical protein